LTYNAAIHNPASTDYFGSPGSYSQNLLQEMYESPELLDEGLLSFEYPLYHATDEELEQFLGSVIHSVAKAAGGVAKAAGSVAKTVGKGISAVNKIIPTQVLTSTLSWTPLGMAARAGLGALQAAGEGRNVFQGAVRSLAADPVSRFYIDTAAGAVRGENVLKAAQKAAQAGIGDMRQSLQFAAMVAPFIPGVGTGVAAALSAANALAAGQPITDALIAAARGAIPGGAVAQMAFDTAVNLAKGKDIGTALLNSARERLPGGPAAQAAFDAAVALAKGRNIQDAAFAAAGRLLPKSPYSADALSFVKKVASGQNIQRAALSSAGDLILNRVEAMGGPGIPRIPAASQIGVARRALSGRKLLPVRREFEEEGEELFDGVKDMADSSDGALVLSQIAAGQRDPNKLTDAVFYKRHPDMQGRRIAKGETPLINEWLAILRDVVTPKLPGQTTSGGGSSDADVRVAQWAAAQPVPNMLGVSVRQLVETWRPRIAPEIAIEVLIAFIRYESVPYLFSDATHGSVRNNFTSPPFYELGIFQTPAGLHGKCTTGYARSCEHPPPGREAPGDPSQWVKLCKRIGKDPGKWTDPETQVRVGLLDLKTSADAIRSSYPELFASIGSDWDLRGAVLMPFARGGGYTRTFLSRYRKQLEQLPENGRWNFLRDKKVGTTAFAAKNVQEKMSLATRLGYMPR
jgi:hypothetical protein